MGWLEEFWINRCISVFGFGNYGFFLGILSVLGMGVDVYKRLEVVFELYGLKREFISK